MPALTPLGISALALLVERPMHPYEMYQLLIRRSEDRVVKVRPGSLYHAVDRLAEQGLATVRSTERAGNRPERTTYEITDAGRERLRSTVAEMLATPVNEYPRFSLALNEAHHLPQAEVVALLTQRLDLLHADLDYLEAGMVRVANEKVERRYWIDVGYQAAIVRAEIEWITSTIGEIESDALSWTADSDCSYSSANSASHKE